MQLAQRQDGAVTIINVSGSLVADDNLALRDAMTRLLQLGHRRIVLDFSELEYVDSAALGELVACQMRAARTGAPLKLVNVNGRLEDLLLITRLITVFETHDTVQQAVDSFPDD